MKRDVALQPLSHQHHNELMGCLLIKKGVKKQADKKVLKDFTLRFWKDDLQQHLHTEESVLFPWLQRHHFEDQLITVLRRDHDTIRTVAERVETQDNGYTVFNAFAELVEQHIRFEERVVFRKIQESLPDQELKQLESALPAAAAKKCTDYPVKFWE